MQIANLQIALLTSAHSFEGQGLDTQKALAS